MSDNFINLFVLKTKFKKNKVLLKVECCENDMCKENSHMQFFLIKNNKNKLKSIHLYSFCLTSLFLQQTKELIKKILMNLY